ncbi:MAG TPA: hypothetical protein RMH26_31000, partial [Polyangiaceae bacterium LLY-WYZ-15_(1-7)]|nr:hypothetical protein [Polyangiaceae bacterium LLY-WYZ-15_(1-7)]
MRLLPAALLGLLACGSEPVPAAGSLDGSVESHFDPPSGRTSSPTSPRSVGGEGECARVLVIFDRSGSMGLEWEGATLSGPRWRLAADAVEAVLGPVAERVEAGALLFPSGPRTDPRACAPVDP